MIGSRHDMRDEQQQRMERVIPTGMPGPQRKDNRKVTAGIFFVLRTGCRSGICLSVMGWMRPAVTALTGSASRVDSRRFVMIFKGLKKPRTKRRRRSDAAEPDDRLVVSPRSPLCRRVAQRRRDAGDRALPADDEDSYHGRRPRRGGGPS